MNLAEYRKAVAERRANGDFIRFEKDGDVKFLRFMYDDIKTEAVIKYKAWNPAENKYTYSDEKTSPEFKAVVRMNCIQYNEDGSDPRRVTWEFSAHIVDRDLVPQLENIKPHKSGVWKVQVNNPGEMNIKIVAFPVMNADTVKFPIDLPEQEDKKEEPKPEEAKPEEPKKTSKYW